MQAALSTAALCVICFIWLSVSECANHHHCIMPSAWVYNKNKKQKKSGGFEGVPCRKQSASLRRRWSWRFTEHSTRHSIAVKRWWWWWQRAKTATRGRCKYFTSMLTFTNYLVYKTEQVKAVYICLQYADAIVAESEAKKERNTLDIDAT